MLFLCDFFQHFQGPFRVRIVQIHKGIVQDQKRLFLAEQSIDQRKAHTQRHAVCRAGAEAAQLAGCAFFIHVQL